MAIRTGAAAVTADCHHIVRVDTKFAAKLAAAIAAAVSAGTITSAEAAALTAWLAQCATVLVVWRKMTGY